MQPTYNILYDYGYGNEESTIAMWMAQNGKIPLKEFQHDPSMQNYHGKTVAMLLAEKGVVPPEQWYHDKYLQTEKRCGKTVFDFCLEGKTVPPQHFCREPEWREQYHNRTQAMLLAAYNINIPKYLYHDPQLKDKEGYTVALLQARNGHIPDKQWEHNKFIRVQYERNYRKYNYSVQNFLKYNNIEVPEQWKYDVVTYGQISNYSNYDYYLDHDLTMAMIQAYQGKIPEQKYYHDPTQTNMFGQTVADILMSGNYITPPKEWVGDPSYQYDDGQTIAMKIASYKQYIPEYCHHDPKLKNKYGKTLADIIRSNNMYVPQEWKDQ